MSTSKIYTIIYIDCEELTEDQISSYSDICMDMMQKILDVDESICEVNYEKDEFLAILIGIDSEKSLVEANEDFLNASDSIASELFGDKGVIPTQAISSDEFMPELEVKISAHDFTNQICQSYIRGEYDSGSISYDGEDYDDYLNELMDEIKSRQKSKIKEWLCSREIKATTIGARLYNSMLIEKVKGLIELDRDKIIRQCGYIDEEGAVDYVDFYHNFCNAIKWQKINWNTKFCRNIVQERNHLSTPMLSYDKTTIIGKDLLTVSEFVAKVDEVWTEKKWKKEKYDGCPTSGPFETGNPHSSSKGYFYGHMSLEEAFYEFSGDIPQSFRPAYSELSEDNEGDLFNNYLAKRGEHPKELIEFMKKYEDSL